MKTLLILLFSSFILTTHATEIQSLPVDSLKSRVLKQLGLTTGQIYEHLLEEKVLPYAKKQSVLVVARQQVESEDFGGSYEVHATIVVADNQSGKILQKTEAVYIVESEAYRISFITIDTAPYMLTKAVRAFGIRVHHHGMSRASPSDETYLSLYVQEGKNLRCVLTNEAVRLHYENWDLVCEGDFHSTEVIVSFEPESTNGYFNLVFTSRYEFVQNKDVNGDCEETIIEEHKKKTVFYYNGKTYN